MIKEVKLVKFLNKLYLIENKEGDEVTHLATPEQIGVVCETLEHETMNEYWTTKRYVELNDELIQKIMNKGGLCRIEMETYEGDYCGYRKPKLKDGKVIIHI